MRRPAISVAMCTFNGGRFLRAQLESIAAQLRPPEELVICDDGSSDNTGETIRNFSRRSSFPVRFVVNASNLGTTRNFAQAIELCQGKIIALADQDDVWYAHKLERFEKAFLQSNPPVAVFSDADLIDDESQPLGLRLWPTFGFNSRKQQLFASDRALDVLIRHPVVTGAAMAFRKDLFPLLAPIPPNELHDRWISFLLAACGRFDVISEPLMRYRRHSGQQVGPGPLTVQGQLEQARNRGPQLYQEEIQRFRLLSIRLAERQKNFPKAEYAQQKIAKKLSHLAHRAQLPPRKTARLPKVAWEMLNRNYWRCSGGWRSIAKDLVIR